MRTIVIVIALVALVAGCMSREQRLARDRTTCTGYGYQVGTDAFADCVQGQGVRRAAAFRRANKSVQDWVDADRRRIDALNRSIRR